MSHAAAREYFAELDDESLAALDWIYLASSLYIPPERQGYYFFDHSQLTKTTREKRKAMRECQRQFQRRYGISNAEFEVCYYQHGLKMLPNAVVDYIRGKDFLDIGAYAGESSLVFMDYSPRRVIAFEPSAKSRRAYARNLAAAKVTPERYRLEPFALGESAGKMNFNDSGAVNTSPCVPGNDCCEVLTLDSYTTGKSLRIGFIKADVEGMGLAVVKGALQTLQRDRPVLSLAVYHNASELFDAYALLKQQLSGYVFHLRLLNDVVLLRELALIAYPKELVADDNSSPQQTKEKHATAR
jgi:FkbM family methyltransferase